MGVCLVLLASGDHPLYRLVIAANRDEFHARPAAAAGPWAEIPGLIAGRDLQALGTWLGVKDDGRFAALTNYRDPKEPKAPRSRGELPTEFLRGHAAPRDFFDRIRVRRSYYNGFTLIAGEPGGAWVYTSRTDAIVPVPPGVHGLSNHLLDTPWPKVARTKEALGKLLGRGGRIDAEEIFALLGDRAVPADEELPDTGVGLDLERFLSSPFIVGAEYGTRSSTAVLFHRGGRIELHERSFGPDGKALGTVAHSIGPPCV